MCRLYNQSVNNFYGSSQDFIDAIMDFEHVKWTI